MLSLKTIGERENQTTVTLRGREVTVRGLTVAERDRLRVLFLRPEPPVGKPPHKGDLAPPEPLRGDPEYRRKLAEHTSLVLAVEAAIALDWRTEDGEPWQINAPDAERWARQAAAEIANAGFSEAELNVVFKAIQDVEAGGDSRGN